MTGSRGRSEIAGSGTTTAPGTRSSRKRCATIATTSGICVIAKRLPMHFLAPLIARVACLMLRREAIRIETLGVRPEVRMAMGDVRAEDHVGARRQTEAADVVVLDGAPHEHEDRRIQAHGLEENPRGVLEPGDVLRRGRPVAEDAIDLLTHAPPALRSARQEVPRPRQSR